MSPLTLKCLDGVFSIYRYPPNSVIPSTIYESSFLSITKTDEELSIVCDAGLGLDADEEGGWSCLKVQGPLDFSLTGVLSKISRALADAEISLFAVSTYDTDYILVKTEKLAMAIEALVAQGHEVT